MEDPFWIIIVLVLDELLHIEKVIPLFIKLYNFDSLFLQIIPLPFGTLIIELFLLL